MNKYTLSLNIITRGDKIPVEYKQYTRCIEYGIQDKNINSFFEQYNGNINAYTILGLAQFTN